MAESATGKCTQCAALAILGLEPGAGDKEIRSTYHLLVKVWHPDRFQTDSATRAHAEEKLKAINEAYRVLREKPWSHRRSPKYQPAPQESHQASTSRTQTPQRLAPARAFASILRRVLIPRLVMPAFSVVAAIVVFWLIFKPIDAFLASNPATAYYYSAPRAEAAFAFDQLRANTWDRAAQALHGLSGGDHAPPAATNQTAENPEATQHPAAKPRHGLSVSSRRAVHLLPDITVGMTKTEVIAVQGPPTSDSGDKLIYGKSELDFNQGKLSGWRIDPSTPLRVKLWPNAAVNPNLDYFTLGSSKNEVLVVQGTPTLLSQNVFGYGSSLVYFRDNRVVNWKSDPASVQLRTTMR